MGEQKGKKREERIIILTGLEKGIKKSSRKEKGVEGIKRKNKGRKRGKRGKRGKRLKAEKWKFGNIIFLLNLLVTLIMVKIV